MAVLQCAHCGHEWTGTPRHKRSDARPQSVQYPRTGLPAAPCSACGERGGYEIDPLTGEFPHA